jgi:hypothetical protein
MATISDLFKKQNKEIYGLSGKAIIESKGLINPPRGAALLTSSPSAIGDLIGNQIGGALGGSANRPSDTIFKGKSFIDKPISLFKTQQQLKNAIEPGKDYFIKESPAPGSIISSLNSGASSLTGVVTNLAINAVTKGGLKNLSEKLKKKKTGKTITLTDGTELPIYTKKANFSKTIDVNNRWDTNGINDIREISEDKLVETIKKYTGQNIVPILFKKYGTSVTIPFQSTLSNLSEDVQSEWSNFKYLGSPFKIYKYQGVERTLKFNLKLYYFTPGQKEMMISKINFLKSLAFPYEEISEMTYGGDTQTSQYAFSPNLFYLTIGDMYKNVFGLLENISFQVDDNITWPTLGVENNDNYMYPSVINVSISMKLIENHKVEKTDGGITKYRYDFDGRGPVVKNPKKEEQKKIEASLNQKFGVGEGHRAAEM